VRKVIGTLGPAAVRDDLPEVGIIERHPEEEDTNREAKRRNYREKVSGEGT
jgi:hypothetical protein